MAILIHQYCTEPPLQVLPTGVLWGGGTALGEGPPYALGYRAAKAGKRSAEGEAMLGMGSAQTARNGGGEQLCADAARHVSACWLPAWLLCKIASHVGKALPHVCALHSLFASLQHALHASQAKSHVPLTPGLAGKPTAEGPLAGLVNRMKNWMLHFIQARPLCLDYGSCMAGFQLPFHGHGAVDEMHALLSRFLGHPAYVPPCLAPKLCTHAHKR